MQTASYPYDSTNVTLVHEDELQFWRTKYFWQHRVLTEEHSPTHFFRGLVYPVIRKVKVTNFHVPTHQKYQCSAKYVEYSEKISSGIPFEKITRIRIRIIFGPNFLDEYE